MTAGIVIQLFQRHIIVFLSQFFFFILFLTRAGIYRIVRGCPVHYLWILLFTVSAQCFGIDPWNGATLHQSRRFQRKRHRHKAHTEQLAREPNPLGLLSGSASRTCRELQNRIVLIVGLCKLSLSILYLYRCQPLHNIHMLCTNDNISLTSNVFDFFQIWHLLVCLLQTANVSQSLM